METTAFKTCTGPCGLSKPLETFSKDKKRPDGKSDHCRICRAKRARELHAQNLESRRSRQRKRYVERKALGYKRILTPADTLRNKKHYKKRMEEAPEGLRGNWQRSGKTYRKKHPERIRISNQSPRMKAWRRAHPEKIAAKNQRRRARKQGLPNTWTTAQCDFMLEYWHHSCAACGNAKGLLWTLAFDHWIPLASAQCPGTVATNMVPLCNGNFSCNSTKSDLDAHEWLFKRFGAKKAVKIEKAIAIYFAHIKATFNNA
jgi:hypothetical protein